VNEILIYSDIGTDYWGEAVSAVSVKAQLDAMQGDVSVRINSPGGDVFDGFAIFNLLAQYKGKVTVYIDGLAASAASVIAMAGDEIIMGENALMMIHDPWTMSLGNSAEMRSTADLLDKIRDSIVATYATKSTLDTATIADLMSKETWLSAGEAIKDGFATSTAVSAKQVSNVAKPWINNGPKPEQIKEDIETQSAWRVAINRRKLSILD